MPIADWDNYGIASVLLAYRDLLAMAWNGNFPRVAMGKDAIARVRTFHSLGLLDENLALNGGFRRVLQSVMNDLTVADLEYEEFLTVAARTRDWLPNPNLLPKAWSFAAYELRSAG